MLTTTITVIGKADLGFSWKFGQIIKGQEYAIAEEDFTPDLFVRQAPQTTIGGNK